MSSSYKVSSSAANKATLRRLQSKYLSQAVSPLTPKIETCVMPVETLVAADHLMGHLGVTAFFVLTGLIMRRQSAAGPPSAPFSPAYLLPVSPVLMLALHSRLGHLPLWELLGS